jgi:hypothetical protein
MKVSTRPLLLLLLLMLLMLPGLNMRFEFFKSTVLDGDVQLAPNAWFNIQAWLSGDYQAGKEKYFNDNVGFRPELVRTNNEIDYQLFGKLHAANVVLGKDNYLYEQGYIDARNGKDFAGYRKLGDLMRKLRYVQDTLKRAGKEILFVFTPSKGRYYPEYFPSRDRQTGSRATNYEVMKRLCDSLGINNLDLNGWFMNKKQHTEHPLFSKQGIHWTRWAGIRAADTFNKNLEQRLGIDIPDITLGKDSCGPVPIKGDNDIAVGINLWHPITKETWCYNRISFDTMNKQKPQVIFITDSFFWTWASDQVPQQCYNDWEFWYYFEEIWSDAVFKGDRKLGHISDNEWMAKLESSDALVFMLTEINLRPVGERSIQELYRRLGGK